jgi:hypothetical protein
MAAVCEHFHIGPAAVREATWEEYGALIRQMNQTRSAKAQTHAGG